MRRFLVAAVMTAVLLVAGPVQAHTCKHTSSTFTRIGTSSQYYKWHKDSNTGGNVGHYTNIYGCGSNGCVYLYTHGHVPATSACPGHYYVSGIGDPIP